ncbi:MAG: hypothetical protein BWK79_20150 [Beggiatoa sp. IS2]|nr:MAG: hypothetical protein BWK79_20150 [Beggiatoa sp. IS2]
MKVLKGLIIVYISVSLSLLLVFYGTTPLLKISHQKVLTYCEPLNPNPRTIPIVTELECDKDVTIKDIVELVYGTSGEIHIPLIVRPLSKDYKEEIE